MQKHPILVDNGTVLTFGDDARVLQDCAVLVIDGLVAAVGPSAEVRRIAGDNAKIIDAHGGVVTPGLVNSHMHLYSTFACGITPGPTRNFTEILDNLWWRLDRAMTLDDVRLSALVPAIRCLKSGVTTIIDHHASYGATSGSLDVVADTVRGLGLRACLAYEVSDRHGDTERDRAIRENVYFIESLDSREDPGLAALFGLHASFTLSDESLEMCLDAAGDTGFHIHCAEDLADMDDARAQGFKGVVDRLDRFGILRPGTIAAHCIHVTPEEVETLAATGTVAVTNPQSNMNNAVGASRVDRMIESGCRVGLGSDGMGANMLDEVRAAILSHRQLTGRSDVMFVEAVDMLTVANPKIASSIFQGPVGIIENGAAGDIVVWDYFPPTPIRDDNAAGHIVFGLSSSRPRTVVCSGRVLVDDYEVTGVDECAVATEASARAMALWERW